MAIVLPGRQHKPNFYEGLIGGLAQSAPQALENYQARQEQQRREALLAEQSAKKAAQEERMKQLELKSKEKIPFLKEEAKGQRQRELLKEIGLYEDQENQQENQFAPTVEQTQTKPMEKEKKPLHERIKPEQELGLSVVAPQAAATVGRQREFAQKEKHHEQKQVSESYKENQDYINSTYDKYEDALRRDAILDRQIQLNETGELSDSGIINALKTFGLPEELLKNPANEEYTKLAFDLLGGGTLQADYGSRVLQSEFSVSMQRIPTLSQTPEGRRQITENMKTMLLPAKLKQQRLQYYLDKAEREGKPLPHNLRGKILKDIQPQLEEAYDKFKQRNGRYKVKEGTKPDANAAEKYFLLADKNVEKAKKMMEEDGYQISTPIRGISGGRASAKSAK